MAQPSRPARFPLALDALAPRPAQRVAASGSAVAAPAPAARPTQPPAAPAPSAAAASTSAAASGVGVASSAAAGPRAQRQPLRPQRLLMEAVRDAGRLTASAGLGLDSDGVRRRMVERLRADGIGSEALLAALASVPRHAFVDTALVAQAYEDTSLPIGHEQTISKPSVVARMIDLLLQGEAARRTGRLGPTLEIGTGCGYQAAVLAQLAQALTSVERIRPLHEKAVRHLRQLGLARVRLVLGDGMRGHAPRAPYQSIIAAAGGDDLPTAWLDQLAVGGRLVAPMRRGRGQVLVVVDRSPSGLRQSEHEAVLFVPLKSGVA